MRLEELSRPAMLASLFADVRRRSQAAGVDAVTPEIYARQLDARLEHLADALRRERWMASPLLRIRRGKPDGGVRRLAIPVLEDRIVLELLRRALEPLIEPRLSDAAFAYRPGRSARVAVDEVTDQLRSGAGWVALADIRDFFDSIPLAPLIEAVQHLNPDPPLLRLLDRLLRAHALDQGRGLAQGSSLSPLLSNLALSPLDQRLVSAGHALVRYCDNLCVVGRTRDQAAHALAAMVAETRRLGLSLKPRVSRIAEARQGFLWLGFWLCADGGRVSDGALRALSTRADAVACGLQGDAVRDRLSPIVRGWVQYFDAPLPDGAHLGAHDRVLRELIAAFLQARDNDPPARGSVNPGGKPGSAEGLDDDSDTWQELGQEPEFEGDPAAPSVERLLADADRLAAAGDFPAAEATYQAALAMLHGPETPAAAPVATDPGPDDEAIDAFIGLFAAGQETFEAAPPGAPGQRPFSVVRRAITPADVRDHLAARKAIAVRPRLPDGTCTLGVLDIDGADPSRLSAAQAHADALASIARAWGWQLLVETTGGRGLHLWIPVDRPVPADMMTRILKALQQEAGAPAAGVRVEHLPAADDAPELHGQPVTLPLSAHVETGARSRLRWLDGTEVHADLRGLFAWVPNTPEALRARLPSADTAAMTGPGPIQPPLQDWAPHGQSVARVMEGCAVLTDLARKARATGHLDHSERLSLLYSLGHLGRPGERAIHAVISACQNYDPAETSRQIANMRGLPISCTRMREKHAGPALLPLCCCDFGDPRRRGGYATPLLHAGAFRRTWRDTLRERREAEARPRDAAGIAVETSAPDPEPELQLAAGSELIAGAPPHEWA